MGIQSHAFGRVTLTEDDAKKFTNQVKYGKPKAAAKDSIKRARKFVGDWDRKDSISFTITVRDNSKQK